MATYLELEALANDESAADLRRKVLVAISVKSVGVLDDVASTANGKKWATDALQNPTTIQSQIFNYILGKSNTATLNEIINAADATVQAQVDIAIDGIVGALG